MSRIHGTRAIIENSILGEALGQITTAARINLSALYASTGGSDVVPFDTNDVLKPAHGGTGVNNGSNTLIMDGNLNFSGGFTTTGEFSTVLAQVANTTLTLPNVSGTLATQAYVDGISQALDIKNSCRVATQAALPAVTYAANVLTADANGAIPAQDGVTMVVGDRLLVKNQAAALQNGIYVVTALGDESNPFVLTRSEDCDGTPENEVSGGMFAFVEQGTVSAGHGYVTVWNGNIAVGTDPVNFTQFSGAGQLIAGNGIEISGNTINVGASYWDDLQAVDTLNMAELVTYGLVEADLQKLADLEVTAAELNELNGAGCTNADFVKLHNISVSAVQLSDVATLSVLASTANGEGASLIGIEAISGVTASTVQAALAELKGNVTTIETTLGNLVFSGTNYLDGETEVQSAFVVLDQAIADEVTARGDAIAQEVLDRNAAILAETNARITDVDAEEARALAAEAVIAGDLAAETLSRTNADATELARALAAEAALQQAIDDLSGAAGGSLQDEIDRATAAEAGLADDIAAEALARSNADTALQASIDALGAVTEVDYEFIGVGDNSTVLFTAANGYIAGSLKVFINGLLMEKGTGTEEVNETSAASGTFTFGEAPKNSDRIVIAYRYSA